MTTIRFDSVAPVAGTPPPTGGGTRLDAAAKQFEQLFLQQLVTSMRSNAKIAGEGGLFGTDAGAGTYESWFDQRMAEHLAGGQGLGIAHALLRTWSKTATTSNSPLPALGGLDATA